MSQARRNILLGILFGTAYGLGLRLLIAVTEKSNSQLLGGVSVGFLCFGPLAIGYLTTRMHPDPGWWYRLFAPWLPVVIGTAVTALTGVEGWACIVMGLPILLPMSTLGGLLGAWVRPRSPLPVAAFALLPFVSGGIERGIPEPVALRTVESTIDIEAAPARVWGTIVQVPPIAPGEIPDALYLRMGFPRPIAATIDGAGVGAMRRATFGGNLVFHETVTDWQEPRRLSFRIAAQTDSIPPTTLDRHIIIGGEYFDVLQGTYVIQPTAQGVRLRLTSNLRVSTHLNPYAGPWADAIMRSIQETILAVEKKRAEEPAS
jgi:hypothetical protein